jgi:hypothetical protein
MHIPLTLASGQKEHFMKSSRILRSALIGAGLALLFHTSAQAAVEIAGTDTEGPFVFTHTGSFALPQFDTLGGARTLTGVTVDVTIDSLGGMREFDNQSGTGGSIVLAIGSTVSIKGPVPGVGTQIIVNPQAVTTATTSITATTDGIPADFKGSDYAFVLGTDISDLKSATLTGAGDLLPYVGSGMVTFDWDAGLTTAGEDVSVTGGGSFNTIAPTYYFHTTVSYAYVPEPAAITWFGLPLLLLARRRSRGVLFQAKRLPM